MTTRSFSKLTARTLRSDGYEVITRCEVIGTSFAVSSERSARLLAGAPELGVPRKPGE
jgi:hypothetical protein